MPECKGCNEHCPDPRERKESLKDNGEDVKEDTDNVITVTVCTSPKRRKVNITEANNHTEHTLDKEPYHRCSSCNREYINNEETLSNMDLKSGQKSIDDNKGSMDLKSRSKSINDDTEGTRDLKSRRQSIRDDTEGTRDLKSRRQSINDDTEGTRDLKSRRQSLNDSEGSMDYNERANEKGRLYKYTSI